MSFAQSLPQVRHPMQHLARSTQAGAPLDWKGLKKAKNIAKALVTPTQPRAAAAVISRVLPHTWWAIVVNHASSPKLVAYSRCTQSNSEDVTERGPPSKIAPAHHSGHDVIVATCKGTEPH